MGKNIAGMEVSFNINNAYAAKGICKAVEQMTENYSDICLIFVGTDANIGDSLAPLAASIISVKNGNIFTYGNLNCTITANEVPFMCEFVKNAHPTSFCLVIDAAVGKKEDVGVIKVQNRGIKPGLGVNKDLPMMGNGSIIGIISEKSEKNGGNLAITRLSYVYKMAKVIAEGLQSYINGRFSPILTSNSGFSIE